MSATKLPESIDVWRMASARRILSGTLPLQALPRLCGLLADAVGEVEYTLEFGRDEGGTAFARVRAGTEVPLLCQRTLDVYRQPVTVDQYLGLVRNERDEVELPSRYEPLLVESDTIQPRDLIEDELILALPIVPRGQGPSRDWIEFSDDDVGDERPNPFQSLERLRRN